MPVRSSGVDAEHERWRNLRAVAQQLAQRHDCYARVVRSARRFLADGCRLRSDEIAVTWTASDAELLRAHLTTGPHRIFPAAPRVRHRGTGRAFEIGGIPSPRERGDEDDG
jgi:hypothetical protein